MNLIPRGSLFDIDRFFDDFYAPRQREQATFFSPRVDIKDKGDHYEISAELAGVSKDDLHVHLADGTLTIEAETKQEDKEEKDGKLIRQERRYGKFVRSFSLSGDVKEENISAQFKDGVLFVSVPKLTEEQVSAKRRINVQ